MDVNPSDLNSALRGLLDDVARTLGVPLALLSRDQAGWRFEAEAFPPRPVADAPRFRAPAGDLVPGAGADVTTRADRRGPDCSPASLRDREWLLMLPGSAERWNAVAGLESVIGRFGQVSRRRASRR